MYSKVINVGWYIWPKALLISNITHPVVGREIQCLKWLVKEWRVSFIDLSMVKPYRWVGMVTVRAYYLIQLLWVDVRGVL